MYIITPAYEVRKEASIWAVLVLMFINVVNRFDVVGNIRWEDIFLLFIMTEAAFTSVLSQTLQSATHMVRAIRLIHRGMCQCGQVIVLWYVLDQIFWAAIWHFRPITDRCVIVRHLANMHLRTCWIGP